MTHVLGSGSLSSATGSAVHILLKCRELRYIPGIVAQSCEPFHRKSDCKARIGRRVTREKSHFCTAGAVDRRRACYWQAGNECGELRLVSNLKENMRFRFFRMTQKQIGLDRFHPKNIFIGKISQRAHSRSTCR